MSIQPYRPWTKPPLDQTTFGQKPLPDINPSDKTPSPCILDLRMIQGISILFLLQNTSTFKLHPSDCLFPSNAVADSSQCLMNGLSGIPAVPAQVA